MSFRRMGIVQIAGLAVLLSISVLLTALALFILVRDKGYSDFRVVDAYHTLNLSQLASMIPGGVWGFAGFAGFLWSKGVSKVDSVIIIFLNTLTMLTACAVVGVSGLASTLGWGYAFVCFLPFLFVLFSRDWLDTLRQRYYPESSSLPSALAIFKVLGIGIVIWLITASGFTWILYSVSGFLAAPFWVVLGAYATGYLGGYLTIFVPSGLGVSEGLTTLMLSHYIDTGKVMASAISFRIFHSLIIWCNILITLVITSAKGASKNERA